VEFKAADYQTLIAKHIADNPRCAIWASMGMGKTSSTLTALVQLDLMEDVYPALVLAPLRVAKNTWPAEVRKWDHTKHLRVSPIVGTVDERRMACARKADVYTTNYDNLVWLVEHYGDRWPFKMVISDESTRLKSFRTRQGGIRTQALSTVAHTKIKRFVELTGTPAPNGLKDLWGQLWFIDGGARLGRNYTAFMSRWFGRDYDGYGVTAFKHAQDEIQAKLKDVCLTVDAKDYFDLEEPIVKTIGFKLPVRARNLYDEMEKELFMMIEEHEVEAFNAAAKTQKLLQLCSGAVYVDPLTESDSEKKRSKEWKLVHDEKLDVLESIIEEAAGMPVLVAYHFKSDLARLLKRFPQGRALDTNPKTEDDWNAGKIPVLFAHPASAGHGLNLQFGGNILVYFSHDWNLENRMQILERIGPMRQLQAKLDRPVFVYLIVAENSVEELVIARVDDKREVQDILLSYMKRKP
jgi:SNF2 family DNA or RNA helicase